MLRSPVAGTKIASNTLATRALATLALVAAVALLALEVAGRTNSASGEPPPPSDAPCLFDSDAQPLSRGTRDRRAPDIQALIADKKFTVAALFGRMGEGPMEEDKGHWSREQFESYLRSIGFEETGDKASDKARYVGSVGRGIVVEIDILGPAEGVPQDANQAVGAALASAMRSHELVYYNGHSMRGSLAHLRQASTYEADEGDTGAYGILVLDSCWSTQLYGLQALDAAANVRRLELVVNDTRSVTGSVHSFVALLEGLLSSAGEPVADALAEGSWQQRLGRINQLAQQRADERATQASEPHYPAPEKYRLVRPCEAPTKEARLTPPPGNQTRSKVSKLSL